MFHPVLGTIWQDLTPGDEKLAMRIITRRFNQQAILRNEFRITKKVDGQFVEVCEPFSYFVVFLGEMVELKETRLEWILRISFLLYQTNH